MLGKRLTFENLERSQEIQAWLNQFSANDVLRAKSLLCRLQFISRDEYANWLLSTLAKYSNFEPTAVYAVRKFRKNAKYLWNRGGKTQYRPAQTQGSEDLVASVISNANRKYHNCFLDHPSLDELRNKKVRHIILVDDSIGSGKRVADFIQLMTNNKTFLSWWSGGYITIHVLSYARTGQSEKFILDRTPGSNHGERKIPLSQKLKFDSDLIYDAYNIHPRWGNASQAILSLCSSNKKISKDWRKGFGDVMGNIIFYHSVPNNIPGLLFSNRQGWKPLFPNRSLPDWTIKLLGEPFAPERIETGFEQLKVSTDMSAFLKLLKAGLRTRASLSRRLDCDERITQALIDQALRLGFISHNLRLLESGYSYLCGQQSKEIEIKPNYNLYIPQSWCAGQATVQPSDHDAS
jgi:hypothetical protein